PNGVDLTRFHPVPIKKRARVRRSFGVPAGAAGVVFAARFDGVENRPPFLRAAKAYLKRESSGHVLMCGGGMSPANADLCHDVEAVFDDEPTLLQRLHLLGVRHDMEAVYATADVVALTSSVGEAAPLCLIEGAMCAAVPVATDVGDCASIVSGLGLIAP